MKSRRMIHFCARRFFSGGSRDQPKLRWDSRDKVRSNSERDTCFSHRHLGMFYSLRGHFTLRGICWVCLSSGTKRMSGT